MFLPRTLRLASWKDFLTTFCINQLCITLISWPILIWWGLPVALLSPIGNLIFSPFLTGFLLFSLLVTVTQLFLIPNYFFIKALDGLVSGWLFITAQVPTDWTITLIKPPLIVGLLPPIAAIFIMQFRGFKKNTERLAALIFIAIIFPLLLQLFPCKKECELQLGSQKIIVNFYKNKLNALLPRRLYTAENEDQWIDYTLRPELARQFGKQNLETCTCTQLTEKICSFLKTLCKKGCVQHLIIPQTPLHLVDEIKRYAIPKGITVTSFPCSSWQALPLPQNPRHRKKYIRGVNGSSKHPSHAPQ